MTGWLLAATFLSPPETIAAISVVDLQGKPIGDATIRMRTIKNFALGDRDVLKGGFLTVPLKTAQSRTDESGRWISPPLPGEAGYVVEAKAPGFVGDFSRWIHPSEHGRVELPPIRLRRLVSVSGTVKDRSGRPLADVRVFSTGDGPALRECRTNRTGEFTLKEVPEGRILIFADRSDHYLTGAIADDNTRVSLTLASRSVPNPERMPPQPPAKPLPIDPAIREQARTAAIAHASAVFAQKKDDQKFHTANMGAFQAPDFMLRLVRGANYEKAFTKDQCLYVVAACMDRRAKWEPEIIASEVGSNYRQNVYHTLQYYEKDSAKRYEHFSRMALEAREAEDEQSRMYALANLAETVADAGFVKEAASLAQEAEAIAERLPKTATNDNNWHAIAMAWSLVDTAKTRAAAAKIKGFRERLAANVAKVDPQLATEIFDDYSKTLRKPSAGHWISELAYHIAKTDLPKAERYANNVLSRTDRFDPVGSSQFPEPPKVFGLRLEIPRPNEGPAMWRGVLQGFLADARLQVGDKEGAKRLLADAVRRLERIQSEAWHTGGGFHWNNTACLAALIPLAERIDESLLSELVWKTLASLPPTDEFDSANLSGRGSMHVDALRVVSRHRPDLAKIVIERIADRSHRQSWRGETGYAVSPAFYEVDPAAARRWRASLCDLPNPLSNEKPAKSPRAYHASNSEPYQDDPEKAMRPNFKGWRYLLSSLWLNRVVDKNLEDDE